MNVHAFAWTFLSVVSGFPTTADWTRKSPRIVLIGSLARAIAKLKFMTKKDLYLIIETSDNSNKISLIYDKLMYTSIIISLIPLLTRETNIVFLWIDWISTIFFSLDYIFRWYTANYKLNDNSWKVYLKYPFTLAAIIDLMSILPIISYFNYSLRIFKVWRLFRIIRVARIFRYYEPLQILIRVLNKKSEILLTVVYFAVFYILITALIMFNLEPSVNPENGKHFFDSFADAVYWSACTLTTVGYGDIYPITIYGRFVSVVSALVGIAIVALPSGIITAGYMEEIHEKHNNRRRKKNNRKKKTVNEKN